MLRTFNSIIRPTLEFAAPTFHPMLTGELRDKLESVQKRASKLVFGWGSSYDEIISNGKMKTLDSRREELTANFARKAVKSERFGSWFKEKIYDGINLRDSTRKKYEEKHARTERLRRSPVYYMTRILNEK